MKLSSKELLTLIAIKLLCKLTQILNINLTRINQAEPPHYQKLHLVT